MWQDILSKYNSTKNISSKEWLVLLNQYNSIVPPRDKKPNSAISCSGCKQKIVNKLNQVNG
jgi:hypothetical protein